jgi:hypothetical protein
MGVADLLHAVVQEGANKAEGFVWPFSHPGLRRGESLLDAPLAQLDRAAGYEPEPGVKMKTQ